jgi:uncharacterized membrane protein YhhN
MSLDQLAMGVIAYVLMLVLMIPVVIWQANQARAKRVRRDESKLHDAMFVSLVIGDEQPEEDAK